MLYFPCVTKKTEGLKQVYPVGWGDPISPSYTAGSIRARRSASPCVLKKTGGIGQKKGTNIGQQKHQTKKQNEINQRNMAEKNGMTMMIEP